jgi:hypothetical protein
MDRPIDAFGTIALTFKEGVAIEDIHAAIDRLIGGIGPSGCTVCGLVGIDLLFRAVDPEPYERIRPINEIDSVLEVSHKRGSISF